MKTNTSNPHVFHDQSSMPNARLRMKWNEIWPGKWLPNMTSIKWPNNHLSPVQNLTHISNTLRTLPKSVALSSYYFMTKMFIISIPWWYCSKGKKPRICEWSIWLARSPELYLVEGSHETEGSYSTFHQIQQMCSDKQINHELMFLVLSHANMSVNH